LTIEIEPVAEVLFDQVTGLQIGDVVDKVALVAKGMMMLL
jgi:hypothetical protein